MPVFPLGNKEFSICAIKTLPPNMCSPSSTTCTSLAALRAGVLQHTGESTRGPESTRSRLTSGTEEAAFHTLARLKRSHLSRLVSELPFGKVAAFAMSGSVRVLATSIRLWGVRDVAVMTTRLISLTGHPYIYVHRRDCSRMTYDCLELLLENPGRVGRHCLAKCAF